MKLRALFAISFGIFAACSDDNVDPEAGVPLDTGSSSDSGLPDAGAPDAPSRPDSGRSDSGFSDPDIIRAQVATVAGLRTYFEIHGTETSTMPPLFVVQRGPGTSHEYLPPLLEFLIPKRKVVFYDMRGTGLTSYGDGTGSSTITAGQHALDLAELIDFVGTLPEGIDVSTIDLFGHEYGAGIASLYAAAHPSRVSKLVLVNPYPQDIEHHALYREEVQARLTMDERARYYAILNRPECFGSESSCYLQLWNIVGPHYLCDENRDLFLQLEFMHGNARTEIFFVDRQLRESRYDWKPMLPQITADTTVISGPCDPIPVATSTTYVSRIPGATHVVIEGTGQFPMIEDPAAFETSVKAALVHP
jgi:L-proline amide hydrolase